MQILRAARALGDFLLVGLHPDAVIAAHRGPHHPIMNLHERSLSVLACRYVDEVVIGAPWDVTRDLLTTFNISLVVHGTRAEPNELAADDDPYALPKVSRAARTPCCQQCPGTGFPGATPRAASTVNPKGSGQKRLRRGFNGLRSGGYPWPGCAGLPLRCAWPRECRRWASSG